jgi:hypothetical protein
MKKLFLLLACLSFLTAGASAQQTGTVSGTVEDVDGNPMANAVVHLTAEGWHGGHGHGHGHDNYYDQTEDDGSFFIDEVAAGSYLVIASLMGYGHDMEEIEVVAGQNAEVDLVLEMGGHGDHHGDTLVIVELAGYAVVETDSFHTYYYLDTENDSIADYHLSFGPPWYDPGNGARRPTDGDSIWIVGGLMGYSQPQMVIIYEINGLFWREPGNGHGGYGGDCPGNPDSVTLIETNGTAIVIEMPWMNMYYIGDNNDQTADYKLNFGAPWYDPGNGAARPEAGDQIDIVGGLMDGCQNLPVIIVYEINGQSWREPGDTVGLWLSPTSADDKNRADLPAEFMVAGNYPNPFNPSTTIFFNLPEAGKVRISIYDILGRKIAVLADNEFAEGLNEIKFAAGDLVNSGSAVYFYKIETAGSKFTGKMLLLK